MLHSAVEAKGGSPRDENDLHQSMAEFVEN
ncbi:hypothetical protein NPIL_395891, partial [Nephila pilipes]